MTIIDNFRQRLVEKGYMVCTGDAAAIHNGNKNWIYYDFRAGYPASQPEKREEAVNYLFTEIISYLEKKNSKVVVERQDLEELTALSPANGNQRFTKFHIRLLGLNLEDLGKTPYVG